jgi:hypothetical protein
MPMATYTVRCERTNVLYYDVEANSETDAMKVFDEAWSNGEIDIAALEGNIKTVITAKERGKE